MEQKTLSTARSKNSKKTLRSQDPFLVREKEKYDHPLPSREFILELLTQEGVPLAPDFLIEALSITEDEAPLFIRRLRAMERDGELLFNRKGAICVADKLDLIRATVIGHPEGFGFAKPDDGSPDFFLDAWEMRKVLPKDRVMIRESGTDRRGRREGKVVEVVDHGLSRVVGRFNNQRGILSLQPHDRKIKHEFLIPPEESNSASDGDVVVIEITSYPSRHAQPLGRVVEILGQAGDPGMEIEIALRSHDLPFEFSEEAEALAKATPQKVRKKDWVIPGKLERVDLRKMALVTIDGETARDFDDAVYAETKGKGWRVVVAIADVSHYVTSNDALDETARERGTSVYFPRRVIPMLPEQLSNGICSLNPNVERCCMVCDMEITRTGEVKKYKFYPAVMLSKARFTYTDVWALLSGSTAPEEHANGHLLPELKVLYSVFKAFQATRKTRGAIDFDTQETQIIFDDKGKIANIVPIVRNDAHKLIEECMLAANVCAADFIIQNKQQCLFRVHQGPTPEKLLALHQFLNEAGLALTGGNTPTALDYADLVHRLKGRPDAPVLQTVLLRSMQQAVYTPNNQGHFGLAYDAYTHFTSPIRRYPDLMVHRTIKTILANKKALKENWEQLGNQCSSNERRADDASREVTNWLKTHYMRDKIGQEFTGTVSAVTSFGLFVLLDDLYVEGLVHISELAEDYFHYDKARHRLVGEKNGLIFKLGDSLKVKVMRADLELARVDFALVAAKPKKPARRSPAPKTVAEKKPGANRPPRKPRRSRK